MRLRCHGVLVRSIKLMLTVGCLAGFGPAPVVARPTEPLLQIEVDARDLPRKLLHTSLRIPCEPGVLALWYPKWIPGTHAPSGPLDTIGGLRLETPDGKPVPWRRDEVELYRVTCQVPSGVHEIRAQRAATLDAAYTANPTRFRHRRPQPPALPDAAWINQPQREALIQSN